MRAILERDFFTEVTARRFFGVRALVAGTPLVGVLLASVWSVNLPQDIAGRNVFVTAGTLVIAALLLTIPAAFASAIARERVAKAIDVLLATPLPRIQILLGIWAGRALMVLLLAVTTLPFVAMSLTFGGVTPGAFGAWVLLVALTLLWASMASLAVGTLVRDVVSALRGAFVALAVPCFVIPLLADMTSTWPEGPFAPLTRELVWFSPFRILDLIGSTGTWGAEVSHALANYAAFSVGVCCVALLVSLRRLDGRETAGARARRRFRSNPARIERSPVVWLGLARRRRLALNPTVLAIVAGILVVEYAFYIEVDAWLSAGGGLFQGFRLAGFHSLYMLGYLVAAAVLGATSAATTFHRESAATTMQVLFSTPLSNGTILRGLYIAALLTAFPLLLLSWIHTFLAVGLSGYPASSAFVFVPMSGLFFALAVAQGLRVGLHQRSPSRAAALALVSMITSWNRFAIVFLVLLGSWVLLLAGSQFGFFFLFGCLNVLIPLSGCWLPTALLVPLLAWDSESGIVLAMLIGVPVHMMHLNRLLKVIIPRTFIMRHKPKVRSRTWVKRDRVVRRGLAHDGQLRPEWL